MHVLITNDDGVDSPGIHALARTARDLGLSVTVAAPGWDSSGASASFTAAERDGRVVIEERRLDGMDTTGFALEAAPAFIARLGVEGGLGPKPDLVLSGINRGANTGQAVLHSGTVGAALTARTHGVPALAFSLDDRGPLHWETAAAIAHDVIAWAVESPELLVLNVNIPDVPLAEVRGLRPAKLASFGAVQTTVTEIGQGYVKVAYRQPDAELEPGTDAALLADDYACYTPLQTVCEAAPVDLGDITLAWTSADQS
jgi:5'-nucleotidase